MCAREAWSPCRLFFDEPADGAWNMAADEVLLGEAAESGIAALRFYTWSEPTLSLGYFQRAADRRQHAASIDCPLVRRQTGGGAIVHDVELTYALALPLAHPLADDPARLYQAAHDALATALAPLGIATQSGVEPAVEHAGGQPFLCFERRAAGDVLLDGSKICGSAQRRRRGAILQHGSLLLATSLKAPELPGIREISGENLALGAFGASWSEGIAACVGLQLEPARWSTAERAAARSLVEQKYASLPWSLRR